MNGSTIVPVGEDPCTFSMLSIQLREADGEIRVFTIHIRTHDQIQRLNFMGGTPIETTFEPGLIAHIKEMLEEHTASTELVNMVDFRHRVGPSVLQRALLMRHEGGIDLRFRTVHGPMQSFLLHALVSDPTSKPEEPVDRELADLCEGGLTLAQSARDQLVESEGGPVPENARAELRFYVELIKRYIKFRSARIASG